MNNLKGENEWVIMEIKGHFFHFCYKPDTDLTLEAAQKIIKEATLLAGDKIYPCLTDIRNMPPHSKEVREFFAIEGSLTTTANAIIVSNSLSRVLANFFLTLNKPTVPTRIFTDYSKAAKWLEAFPIKARPVLV